MSEAEEQRVIELYKYYGSNHLSDDEGHLSYAQVPEEPSSSALDVQDKSFIVGIDGSCQLASPDTTMTALCQLAAIRLGVQRAGISLIAQQTQYILAESTRTLDLRDTTRSEEAGDGLWMGLTECNRTGNLCENTVGLPPDHDADIPPCFCVPDLSHDGRFSNAPYVAGPPHLRFYCGTPITTPSNLNVGSFWVLDDRLLPELTLQQKRFLGTMASLVMRQLEMTREVSERKRAMKMGQALSGFVEGKMSITPLKNREPVRPSSCRSHVEIPTKAMSYSDYESRESAVQPPQSIEVKIESPEMSHPDIVTEESASEQLITVPDAASSNMSDQRESIDSTFARATYLIREALEVRGCVFLNAASTHLSKYARALNSKLTVKGETASEAAESIRKHSTDPAGKDFVTWNSHSAKVPAEVLAFADERGSSLEGGSLQSCTNIIPVDADFLDELTKRYPNGTIWTFGQTGLITPTGSTTSSQLFGRRLSVPGLKAWKQQRESEAEALRHHFPRACQLIFAPLFDAAMERSTSGCFAFNHRRSRVLTTESEVVFLKSFLNNVGAEISRMTTIASDRSKSDFIGSISHELRSPLHGMLAAAEFLEETELDSYQKSMIGIQVSCGKTLLQVIEHVLDFSKINSVAKHGIVRGRQSSEPMLASNSQALSAKIDVAALCEEVVEGSVAGKAHIVRDISALDSRPFATSMKETPVKRTTGEILHGHPAQSNNRGVAVLLDFDYQKNWSFFTQPGALRRILMNVLGNALKYTDVGYVKVCLSLEEAPAEEGDGHPAMVLLSVTDTGRGISRSFLRTRLFRPFNQEDHLSTGCGLGLSIVKSLVATLDGALEVQSEQDVGTTFSIKLPLSRGPGIPLQRPFAQRQESTQPISVSPLVSSRTIAVLHPTRHEASGVRDGQKDELAVREGIKSSVLKTILGWLHMKPLSAEKEVGKADYIIVLADEIPEIESGLTLNASKAIALLQHDSQRRAAETLLAQKFDIFETIAAPFGPRKLAAAVTACELAADRRQESSCDTAKSEKFATIRLDDGEISSRAQFGHKQSHMWVNGHGPVLSHPLRSREPQRSVSFTNGIVKNRVSEMKSALGHSMYDRDAPSDPIGGQGMAELVIQEAASPDHSAGVSNGRLLLVDDNNINLSLLATFVKRLKRTLDYECAENGLLALEAARRNTSGFDIIFMDVNMPGMDGLEATREIRKLEKKRVAALGEATAPPPALIVALTGLANSRDQIDAFASGVDLFMTKPTKFKEIGRLIEDWYENGSHHIRERRNHI